MPKKTGPGKGLDALFSSNVIEEVKNEEEERKEGEIVTNLKIIDVEPNKNQARKKFDTESLEELAESIKRYGVIQPIVVTKKEKYYEIIAGERRWRASKLAGLTEIPAIIRENDERKNQEISLIENIQREDLNPIEKAKGFKVLMEDYGLTQQQLADTLGISRSTLANTVRLLNLSPKVMELVMEGKLTEGHCRALLVIEDPDKQYDMALRIIERGDNVRQLENRVGLGSKASKKNQKYEAIYRDIEDSFQHFFGTKVKLNAGKKKGKIIIEYNSNEDLERLLELIKE